MTTPSNLLACPECDALQRVPAVHGGHLAEMSCWCCGARLVRGFHMSPEWQLALLSTALILFVVVSWFPLFSIDLGGSHHQTGLFGAAYALWQGDLRLVAVLVFVTTVLAPVFEMTSLLYAVGVFHFRLQGKAPGLVGLLRLLGVIQPWNLTEVFMLGSLVALVKLSHIAEIHVNAAVWALVGVVVLMATVGACSDVRQLWAQLPLRSTGPAQRSLRARGRPS